MRILSFFMVMFMLGSSIISCESSGSAEESTASEAAPIPEVNLEEVLVHFDVLQDSVAIGMVQTILHNASEKNRNLYIQYSFTDGLGNIQHYHTQEQELEAGQRLSKNKIVEVENPILWSPDDPQSYQIAVFVFADSTLADQQEIYTSIKGHENTDTAYNKHTAHRIESCMPTRNVMIR